MAIAYSYGRHIMSQTDPSAPGGGVYPGSMEMDQVVPGVSPPAAAESVPASARAHMSAASSPMAPAVPAAARVGPAGAPFDVDVDTLGKLHQNYLDGSSDTYERLGGVGGVASLLRIDPSRGLTNAQEGAEINMRQAVFGRNEIDEAPPTTLWQLIVVAFNDPTLILLSAVAVVSLGLGFGAPPEGEEDTAYIEGVAICVAIIIVVMVTAGNDYQKEKLFRELKKKKDDVEVKVHRDSEEDVTSIFDVVVGDVLLIDTGDVLPVDGLLLSGNNVQIDESSHTGEIDLKRKEPTFVRETNATPIVLGGTKVQEGSGRVMVTSVGPNSIHGRTLASLQVEQTSTPLEQKLEWLAGAIGRVGFVAAVITFVSLMLRFIVTEAADADAQEWGDAVVQFLLTTIAIVVVAVPEGLPLAVTLALAYSMKQLTREQNFVRHLDATETMGSATTICSDKTGTLTTNRMTVVAGSFAGVSFQSKNPNPQTWQPHILSLVNEGISANSAAYEAHERVTTDDAEKGKGGRPPQQGKLVWIGSRTDAALLGFSNGLGLETYKQVRELVSYHKIFPFHSKKKVSACVLHPRDPNTVPKGIQRFQEQGPLRIHVKGAVEIVLKFCKYQLQENGSVVELSDELISQTLGEVTALTDAALRVIGVAYADIGSDAPLDEIPSAGLTFVGFCGIEDPLREEVPAAVERCQKAGVTIRMVTGDNVNTARKIASQCGILNGGGVVMEGYEFRSRTDAERAKLLPHLRVLARSSPDDKLLLVKGLQGLGETVAVTGDGTNDAPALKRADVGFAMGQCGTPVAHEACDIIILDDNFASIVRAMLWGRNVYDAIAKFVTFQLTVNIVAVLLSFIGAVSDEHGESPLRAVQLLFVNLVMDTLAALALATEAPSDRLLDRPPVRRDDPLITPTMKNMIGVQSMYQLFVTLLVLYTGHNWFDDVEERSRRHLTIIFNMFVFMTLVNEVNCRFIRNERNILAGLKRAKIFVGIWIVTVVVQVLLIEFGGEAVQTEGLGGPEWGFSVAMGFSVLLPGMLLRYLSEPGDGTVPHAAMDGGKMGGVRPLSLESQADMLGYFRRRRSVTTRALSTTREEMKQIQAQLEM